MSAPVTNVFLAGVGGQGILLASEILSEACLASGFDVKKSEVHGMAQRGGAVTTHLRFGERVYSPLIEVGAADVLIAFEKLEALRFVHMLRPTGVAVVNTQEIPPAPVSSGQDRYPERIEERLRAAVASIHCVDALSAALALHEIRSVNMVMTGATSHFLTLSESAYAAALRRRLPEKYLDVNLKAFQAGRALIAAHSQRSA